MFLDFGLSIYLAMQHKVLNEIHLSLEYANLTIYQHLFSFHVIQYPTKICYSYLSYQHWYIPSPIYITIVASNYLQKQEIERNFHFFTKVQYLVEPSTTILSRFHSASLVANLYVMQTLWSIVHDSGNSQYFQVSWRTLSR